MKIESVRCKLCSFCAMRENGTPFERRTSWTSRRSTYIHIMCTYAIVYISKFATCICIRNFLIYIYFIDIDIFIYIELFSCHITTIQTVNVNDNVNLRNASTTASIAFWAIRNASLCQDREINTADQRKDRRETHDGATNLISVSFVALDSALQDVPKMRQRYEIYSL